MGTYSLHTAAATVVLPATNVPGYEITPGYTTQLPGAVLNSEEFDSGNGGWTAGAATRITRVAFPDTSDMSLFIERLATAGAATITRSFSGLIVGRKYYATSRQSIPGAPGTRVMQLPSTPGIVAAESGAGGGGYTAVFIAAATTQTITLSVEGVPAGGTGVYSAGMYVRGFSLTLLASSFYTPPVMQPPVTVPGGTVPLSVKSAEVTLDDAWTPYVQATLVCYAPSIETLEALDPRKGLRVNVTLSQSWGDASGNWNSFGYRAPVTRTFNLSLRERAVDKKTGEMTLTLASDEALLLDYALVATTPDAAPLASQSSLRSIVNYVLGKVGAALSAGSDTDVTVSQSPNLVLDPRGTTAAGNVPSAGGSSGTRTMVNGPFSGGPLGVNTAHRVMNSTAAASFIQLQAEPTTALAPVVAGETYTASAYVAASTVASTPTIYFEWRDAANAQIGGITSFNSPDLVPAFGALTRISGTMIAPPGAVALRLRYRVTGAFPLNSSFTITGMQLEASPVVTTYFDGASTNTGIYTYAWQGTANASTSTRGLVTPRSEQLLDWKPGASAWDFLEPIVQATGYRLWCDEGRVWRLAKEWNTQTQINVSPGTGLTAGIDQISRNEAWYDSVVIEYRWTDREGRQQVKWDIAGVPGNSTDTTVYADTPYPGPGAAASVLRRADGKGRIITPSSINDYKATPGMVLQISLPDSPVQTGMLSSVTWNLPDDVMQVGSRALTDTPASAWVNALGTWAAATGSWAAATGTN